VTNIGVEAVHDGYIGFYFDSDVCGDCDANSGFADDLSGSLREQGIGYVIDNDGDSLPGETPRAFCFKLLHSSVPLPDTSFNWWASSAIAELDFGPRMKDRPGDPYRDFGTGGTGTAVGDANRYYLMRHQEWDYDQVWCHSIGPDDTLWWQPPLSLAYDLADGFDARFLMSFGPFDLAPGQSERFIIATFTTDSIHTLPGNAANLPGDPAAYLANLDFTSMIRNANVADSLAAILVDPLQPPAGLQVRATSGNDVTIGWDGSCLPEVTGHVVYLSVVDPASLPYPGVAPPWLEMTELEIEATPGPEQSAWTLPNLATDRFYLASVSYRSASGTGEPAHPITVWAGERAEAPEFVGSEYVFVAPGDNIPLSWTTLSSMAVDHFNLYRFSTPQDAENAYHAFYDRGFAASAIAPADSFDVNGRRYYYYAMSPYQVLPGAATLFVDEPVAESTTYIVAAVDPAGFESHFSEPVEAVHVPPRDKDILVLTHGSLAGVQFQSLSRVVEFYDSLLTGYDYDLYDWGDSNRIYIETDWHLLMEYNLVVIDDDLRDGIFRPVWEDTTQAFTRYLLSGGRLAYFGSGGSMAGVDAITGAPSTRNLTHSLVRRFFGAESGRIVPAIYLAALYHFPPSYADTIFGFQRADPAALEYPALTYDLASGRINPGALQLWPTNAPLSVSTFAPTAAGEVTHLFGADAAINSTMAGEPVGIRRQVGPAETYLFGFHLWYLELPGARALIDGMFDRAVLARFDPDTVLMVSAWSLEPETLTVHVGNLPSGLSVYDIESGSVRLSETVVPLSTEYTSGVPGFVGDVLAVRVSAADLLSLYGQVYGYFRIPIKVSGSFAGGDPFAVYAGLVLLGKLVGDYDWNGKVNIADITMGVDRLFRGAYPELAPEDMDVSGDCRFGVADLAVLISYVFRDGPPLMRCP
ncbi:MAG TPA: hypothetical protein PKW75_01895, partial [candidate division Zixibacteria bacterium]|nr:hypothetical protein [candidate division Zixibacteria bacterium]